MHCPGSIALEATLPTGSGSTIYAAEGTAAHALAERCLLSRLPGEHHLSPDVQAADYIGNTIESFEVTADMAEAVQVYIDWCSQFEIEDKWIERKFDLAPLKPPCPMFGTADFVAYNGFTDTLHIGDLKFGQGNIVEPKDNPQLMYYALGAALSLRPRKIEHVNMTIVQPRAAHPDGPIRTHSITFEELVQFGRELIAAANRAMAPNAPRIPGKQCKWCKASGICPEQRGEALEVARSAFSVVQPFVPPAPATIPLDEFVHMLSQLHVLEDWAAAMRRYAQQELEAGREIPGWKLIAKRATRQWADAQAAVEHLRAAGWADEDIFAPLEVRSVAQIEKAAGGKKKFAAMPVAELVVKESSGVRMAPESDPNPAVDVSLGSQFPLLKSGETGEEE